MIIAFLLGVVAGVALSLLALFIIGWIVGPEEEPKAEDSLQ